MKADELRRIWEEIAHTEDADAIHSKLIRFRNAFSLERIETMNVDDYVVGKGNDASFCNQLEWGLMEYGSIRGATAMKYGIYYGKYGKDTKKLYRSPRRFGGIVDQEGANFDRVRSALVRLVERSQALEQFEDIESDFQGVFKYKVMFLYNPEIMIPVFADDHAKFYTRLLGLESGKSFQDRQRGLLRYRKQNFPDLDNRQFMSLLYHAARPYETEIAERLYDAFEKSNDFSDDVDTAYSSSVKKKPQKEVCGVHIYPRDKKEASKAYKLSRGKCEICSEHPTFISASSGKPYLETHHLIPMKAQDQFPLSIDVAQNIVCLCSNCHNEIHYGKNKEGLIKALFEKRESLLKEYGIDVSLKDLKKYY